MSTPYYLYSIKDVTTTQNYVTCPNSQNEKKKKNKFPVVKCSSLSTAPVVLTRFCSQDPSHY